MTSVQFLCTKAKVMFVLICERYYIFKTQLETSSLNSVFKNEALQLCNDLHKNKENLRLAHRKFCGQVGFKNVEILFFLT